MVKDLHYFLDACKRTRTSDATTASFGPACFDAITYRDWLAQAGLTIVEQQFVPEGDGGHALFWAQLPAGERSPATN